MKRQHPALTTAAMAATLSIIVLSPRPAFSQGRPSGPDSVSPSQQVAAQQLINRAPEADPNMPDLPYALPHAPLYWTNGGDPAEKRVKFTKIPSGPGTYLGFNDKGSWIRNEADKKVYVWNLKEFSITLGAADLDQVPMDLRNPSVVMKGRVLSLTGQGKSDWKGANSSGGKKTPYIPPGVAGDGNAQHARGEAPADNAGANAANPASVSKAFKGSGATISAGVLTFTLDDPSSPGNGKPMSFKVVRSAMNNPNAAKPNGIAGAWLGEDPKNKDAIVTLYVQGEGGAVSGNVMTGMAAEALKRMMNANRQH